MFQRADSLAGCTFAVSHQSGTPAQATLSRPAPIRQWMPAAHQGHRRNQKKHPQAPLGTAAPALTVDKFTWEGVMCLWN